MKTKEFLTVSIIRKYPEEKPRAEAIVFIKTADGDITGAQYTGTMFVKPVRGGISSMGGLTPVTRKVIEWFYAEEYQAYFISLRQPVVHYIWAEAEKIPTDFKVN